MGDFSVKSVCQMLGIHPSTLRAWERRYQALTPSRTEGGRRRYSQEDIERLRVLIQLVDLGHSIGDVATHPTRKLKEIYLASQKIESHADTKKLAPLPIASMLIHYVEKLQIDKLHQTLLHARLLNDPRTFVLRLISPLMSDIGEQVYREHLSVYHEHALSAIVRVHLGQLYSELTAHSIPTEPQHRKHICLATREGDYHEFGILIAAVLCAVHGWPFFYMGPNLPARALAQATEALGAGTVLVGSVMLPPGIPKQTQSEYVEELDHHLPSDVSLWWGGHKDFDNKQLPRSRNFQYFSTLNTLDQILETSRSETNSPGQVTSKES